MVRISANLQITHPQDKASDRKRISLRARIRILEEHVENIKEYLRHPEYTVDALDTSEGDLDHREGMREREGAAFENVYHIHQPRITLNNQSRNVSLPLLQQSCSAHTALHSTDRSQILLLEPLSERVRIPYVKCVSGPR